MAFLPQVWKRLVTKKMTNKSLKNATYLARKHNVGTIVMFHIVFKNDYVLRCQIRFGTLNDAQLMTKV